MVQSIGAKCTLALVPARTIISVKTCKPLHLLLKLVRTQIRPVCLTVCFRNIEIIESRVHRNVNTKSEATKSASINTLGSRKKSHMWYSLKDVAGTATFKKGFPKILLIQTCVKVVPVPQELFTSLNILVGLKVIYKRHT